MPKVIISAPGEEPRSYQLKPDRQEVTTIGRGSGNDITISCPSVSTEHCQIEQDKEGYVLRDIGSTNGLKRDGYSMEVINLRDGMEVLIGDVPMKFNGDADAQEQPAHTLTPEVSAASSAQPEVIPVAGTLQRRFFSFVMIVGILAMAGIAVMPWLGEVGMAKDGVKSTLGQWIAFLGEFHPLLLHLPIGAVMLVLVMELLGLVSFGKYRPKTTLALFFASVTGIFAVVFGYFLYLTGDFPGELIEEHKRDGIIFTILLIGTFLIRYAADIRFMGGFAKPFYALGLIATTATMMSAGHHGGEITHGDPMDKAPWKKETKEVSADPVVYTEIIHPILEAKCIGCHGPKKKKSGLRMDTYAYLLEGGEETDCLVPGDVENSAMISYLHLPLDDDLRMPPEGKSQLTKEEIQILEWWVKIGAPETAKRSEVELTPAISQALDSLKTPEEIEKERAAKEQASQEAKAAAEQRRARLAHVIESVNQQFPGSLNYISQDSTSLSFTAVSYRKQFDNAALSALDEAAEDITELDLSASAITDNAAKSLERYHSLESLNLNQTAVTDASLSSIGKLNQLRSLNLHSTGVSDEGLKLLYNMSSLKKVYVWNTKVTEAGAKALAKALTKEPGKPAPQVILGSSGKQ